MSESSSDEPGFGYDSDSGPSCVPSDDCGTGREDVGGRNTRTRSRGSGISGTPGVGDDDDRRKPKKHRVADVPGLIDAPFTPKTVSEIRDIAKLNEKTPLEDCHELASLLGPLEEIDCLVGMENVKQNIIDHVLSYTQRSYFKEAEFSHVVIVGPPGCGKTTLATMLARLFSRMGRTKNGNVVVGNRRNMIGSYVGHTAKATQKVIDSAIGGVLLIDEAYSLGDGRNVESGDSFSKACIDTLNQNLTEKGGDFVCIVVGYKKELLRDFFALNVGLGRRFQWWLEVERYSPKETRLIFDGMLKTQGLFIEKDAKLDLDVFFTENYGRFPNHAGSVREFVDKIKITHFRRVFGKREKGGISEGDLYSALQLLAVPVAPKEGDLPPFMYT